MIDQLTGWIVGGTYPDNGIILHTINGGETWNVQALDTIPKLRSCTFLDEYNGWAVGDHGTILHTSDGGVTWEYQQSGTAANLHSICFVDYDNGWISGDSLIILHTENGGIVGIEPDVQRSKFKVQCFPNPFSTSTAFEYELKQPEKVMFTIYNQMGKKVYQTEENQQQGSQHLIWNAEGLEAGIYFCVLKTSDPKCSGQTKKLIKL